MSNAPIIEAENILKSFQVDSPPVDIFNIIEGCGVTVMYEDLPGDQSGLLLVEDGVAKMFINENHHENRQRFTAAHELGHFKLHVSGQDGLFIDNAFYRSAASHEGKYKQEIEANQFAAELLMPKKLLETLKDTDITDWDIASLAVRYLVSEQAMTLRLVNLGYIDKSDT